MGIFKKHFPIQASNIEKCKQLSQAKKNALHVHMALLDPAATTEEARIHAEGRFFFKPENQLLGNDRVIAGDEHLGRLHMWASVARDASKASIPRDIIEAQKRKYLRGDSCKAIINDLSDGLESVAMSPVVWGFVFQTRHRPKTSEIPHLPCRLGLDNLDASVYLRLKLLARSTVKPKAPTGFDAGLNYLWGAGGKTVPRSSCKGMPGFTEVVMPGKSIAHPDGLTYGHIKAL